MTDTITPAEGEHAPLWSDEQIEAIWVEAFQIYISPYGQRKLAKEAMTKIRDDYEATLTSLHRQLQDCGWEVADREITINAMRARLAGEPATFDALGRYLYGEQVQP